MRKRKFSVRATTHPRLPSTKSSLVRVSVEPEYARHWPPLLLLADLYTQALLTMGDDEFFSTGMTPAVARNPLSLDELTAFSRQLLNIAFTLYWREDPSSAQEAVPGLGQVKWENVREKATKCLQALHARECVALFQNFAPFMILTSSREQLETAVHTPRTLADHCSCGHEHVYQGRCVSREVQLA